MSSPPEWFQLCIFFQFFSFSFASYGCNFCVGCCYYCCWCRCFFLVFLLCRFIWLGEQVTPAVFLVCPGPQNVLTVTAKPFTDKKYDKTYFFEAMTMKEPGDYKWVRFYIPAFSTIPPHLLSLSLCTPVSWRTFFFSVIFFFFCSVVALVVAVF